MTTETEYAAELGAAVTEMKQAAGVVTELKTTVEGLSERLAGIEQKTDKGATDVENLGKGLDLIQKKTERLGGQPTAHSAPREEFKQFAAFVSKGTPMETKGINEQLPGNEGRHALPLEIGSWVQDQLVEINPLRSLAQRVTVSSPQFRHLVNIKGATSAWGEEIDTRNQTETPELAKIEPTMFEHYAYAEITQWAARDLFDGRSEQWLQQNIIEEFARSEGEKFINGTGTKEPYGLLNAPFAYDDDDTRAFGTFKALASGPAISMADNLVNMVYDLAASYRRNGTWLMNSATAGTIRKMKDSDGRYLWTDSLVQGQPATLLGYPVAIVEEMPDTVNGQTPIAFGDIKRAYIIADLQGLYVVRDEITKPGWIKLYMFRRLAGHVTDTKAMRLMEIVE
ncbi:phage major capsid protein [Tropicimonas isoalkanivorans]|uniref:Phage major capsid protein, HK97 family n=1 Tax=Tropicimonas isoalkanivorans TaxID=441112 RepID=A0A1I1M566_9RHOB|nr:phage major capsid protein [Tropicimonas isoalkanivorans]SFC77743.1 phage major capsid protein, HK97 family [Tropicimonas isoalkanivorans]